jgi:hypothetical protein
MNTSMKLWALFGSACLLNVTIACELGPAPDDSTYENQSSSLSMGEDAGAADADTATLTSVELSISTKKAGQCRCNPKPNSTTAKSARPARSVRWQVVRT